MEQIRDKFRDFLGRQEDGVHEMRMRDKASAQAMCKDLVAAREQCWRESLAKTKETEECYREELAEKKCLAQCICSKEAKAFYMKTDCHLYSEYFAYEDDPKYKAGREKILGDPARLKLCRQLTMNLANCMFKYNTSCK